VALCTCTLDAPVGQEGIGETHQMQVYNCRSIRAILVLTEPQQLLHIFYPLFNAPAFILDPNHVCGGEVRGIRNQPENFFGRAFPREDDVQGAECADLQPPGIEIAVAGATIGLRDDQRLGPVSPKSIPPITPRLELPAGLEQAAMALQRRGKVKTLLSAGLDHGSTEIVGIKQDHDLHPGGGVELPNEVGGQPGGFPERDAHGRTRLLFDVEPDPPGDDLLAKEQRATNVLVTPDIGVGRRVLHLGHRLHPLAAFAFLGIVEDQIHGVPELRG
jgi:hypothetical protein